MRLTDAEVLAKARDVLAERGWCQGYGYDDGPTCLDGALRLAAGATEAAACPAENAYYAAKRHLITHLNDIRDTGTTASLWFWNDFCCDGPEGAQLALKHAEELALTEAGA